MLDNLQPLALAAKISISLRNLQYKSYNVRTVGKEHSLLSTKQYEVYGIRLHSLIIKNSYSSEVGALLGIERVC